MLRITVEVGSRVLTFRLEGRVTEQWLRELNECWQASLGSKRRLARYVDLTGVTFVDSQGKDCLAAMHRQGAEFIAVDCMTKAIVAEITSSSHPKNNELTT